MNPGDRVGPYHVIGLVGAGGMGEVYKAHDTRLDRTVAIKILPETLANDPERIARFEREAKTLAALNHPNIAQIYDLDRSSGVSALVMELVEGPTLAEKLASGEVGGTTPRGLDIDEALRIALQIAEGLEAAHEQGIIHRDLKPANIKIRPDGTVKLLDFGLAKALDPVSSTSAMVTNSPTLSLGATQAGVLLGTAAYMAPEQARGRAVDRRADIWAFGCVMYEMLTGRRAFEGDDLSITLATVLKSEVEWKALPASTPTALVRLLSRCLRKDPKERLRDIGDARIQIAELLSGATEETGRTAAHAAAPRWRRAAPWMVAAVAVLALSVLSVIHFREPAPITAGEMRVDLMLPGANAALNAFALSPDGKQMAYVAGEGASRLWLRTLTSTTAQPLPRTEGATSPFWSPDSRSIAFFADGKLKRLDIGEGAPQELANAPNQRGGSWGVDGVILLAPTAAGAIFRVAATGGEPVALTKLDRQTSHRYPWFLPDGRHFLFTAVAVQGQADTGGIYLATLDGAAPVRLTSAVSRAIYLSPGFVVWVRANVLLAQPLDLDQRALTGTPLKIVEGIAFDEAGGMSAVTASSTGLVAYRSGDAPKHQLRWFDRSGKALGALGAEDDQSINAPRLAPDGTRAVVARNVQGNWDLWLLDGTHTNRLTFDAAMDRYAVWSPDGTQIAFDSDRSGVRNLYVMRPESPGSEKLLLESTEGKAAQAWSPDGRFLMYLVMGPSGTGGAERDIWILPLEGDRKPQPWLKTTFYETSPQFSTDGHWIAYTSNESRRTEIYVRPFTDPTTTTVGASAGQVQQWPVSNTGGIFPRWRSDGKELYYIGPDGHMMAAPITVSGTTLTPGTPVTLFQTKIVGGGVDTQQSFQYDVTKDGRFLINTIVDDGPSSVTLLLNWKPPVVK